MSTGLRFWGTDTFVLARGRWDLKHKDGKVETIESDGTHTVDLNQYLWVFANVPLGFTKSPQDQRPV